MIHHNLTCDAFQEQLSDYLEGTLADSAVADAELHLAACAECRTLVGDLQAISRGAASLGPLVPSRDLWPGIAARIEPRVLALTPATAAARPWSRRTLGAIAAGLVAVTALSTWQLTRLGDTAPSVAQSVPPAPVTQSESVPASPVQQPLPDPGDSGRFTTAVASPSSPPSPPRASSRPDAATTYANEISKLRSVFDQQSDVLDPRTRAVLSSSLRTIDSAIAEARAALDRDPASQFLTHQLNKSLEQKLGLLRKAALLSST
jgi:hypothetical protein